MEDLRTVIDRLTDSLWVCSSGCVVGQQTRTQEKSALLAYKRLVLNRRYKFNSQHIINLIKILEMTLIDIPTKSTRIKGSLR